MGSNGSKRKLVALDPNTKSDVAQHFEAGLRARVIGQDRAVRAISSLYQVFQAGMTNPTRPLGTMLFLGPTGSGKTHVVEAAAEILFGDRNAVIKIDCAEFQHSHEIAKLIGSPPGYLGHRETHPLLSQEVLHQYHTEKVKLSFVLLDEIEKASDALWNLLLGILDKATLTLGDNRRVDFSRTVIFMTSNLGAAEMGTILRPNLGFAASDIEQRNHSGHLDESVAAKMSRAGVEAARRKFTPEFMNRIDKLIVFKPLGQGELQKILALELNALQQRIYNSFPNMAFVFSTTESAIDYLLREGTDIKYGARHLKRAIDRALVHPMSNLIATRQVHGGDLIRVDYDSDANELTFAKEGEDIPAYAMAQMMGAPAGPIGRLSARASVETPTLAARRRTLAG